jgi:hypothetical protein
MSPTVRQPCAACTSFDGWLQASARSVSDLPTELVCSRCGATMPLLRQHISGAGGVVGCLGCGHPELYRQKEFPKSLGISIVVLAAAAAPFTKFYWSLFAAALIDALLYWVLPERLECYVCKTRHQGFAANPRHPRFDREIEERLKYGERAVMGRPMRPGGTANAPEPEH